MKDELLKWTSEEGITIKWDEEKKKFLVWTKPTGWFIVDSVSELKPGLFETLMEYRKQFNTNNHL